ncbi:hypothetical protein [Haloterrigena salinisoli]|uniref:hypothetical protein n=1 Tax=Haloterrigena salinisoli TaxID=3132747 RepID=UPI0030D13AE8
MNTSSAGSDSDPALESDTGRGPGRDPNPVPDPGADWPAAVGLYVAVVAAGLVGTAAIAGGASSDAVLGLVPTVFTGGLLCGAVVARANPRFALRLGDLRWRTLALCLPVPAVAGSLGLLAATGVVTGEWPFLLAGIGAAGIGLSARVLALVARDLYVEATVDEPGEAVAEWAWYQSGTNVTMIAFGAGLLAVAAVLYLGFGFGRLTVRLPLAGLGCLAVGWAPTVSLPNPVGAEPIRLSVPHIEYPRADIRAYSAGIVVEPRFVPSYRRFVPWTRLTDVRVTDERLVLERRWRPDVRCDRAEIDDLEGVLDALETVRRTGRSPNHRLTSLERERPP